MSRSDVCAVVYNHQLGTVERGRTHCRSVLFADELGYLVLKVIDSCSDRSRGFWRFLDVA
jgi:hypothetical protein